MSDRRHDALITLVRELRGLYRYLYNTRPLTGGTSRGLTRSQSELIALVAKHPDGVTTTSLADELQISSAAVTQAVDSLVHKGLLTRKTNPTDRRSTFIALKQHSRHESFETFYAEHISPLFSGLSDAELQQLITLLEKIDKGDGDEQ